MPTFSGEIKKGDTKDDVPKSLEPGTYNYKLEAGGGGNVRFKVEAHMLPLIGETGNYHTQQLTVEERSRITTDSVLQGRFTVPRQQLSSSRWADRTEVHFILSRGILTKGSTYKVTYNRAS
jgi:hypothetical protein